jgi:Kef-type K+ transport system membrane component KefB
MEVFTGASHYDILHLVIQVAVLLAAARLGGEIAQRFGQPSVVGEIGAGIILGPSLLSGLFPAIGMWVIPQNEVQGYLLELVALIGVMFMLLITGLEIDTGLIRRHARTALGTAAGGLVLPFSLGFALGMLLPEDFLVDPQQRMIFALFVGVALAISAIAVIAKVLIDLNMLRRDVGQVIMASAMIDDITAWTMLSILVGVAAGGALTVWGVLQSVLSVIAFVILSATFGRWLVQRSITWAQDRLQSRDAVLSTIVVLTFAWGALSQALHLEAIIGAFAIGILLGQMPTLPRDVIHTLESVALGIFAPIFFAVAGLKVNLLSLAEPRLFMFGMLFLAIACIGKIVGAYAGARVLSGSDHWTAMSFGVALNARGAVEIIIASIGLSLGLLTQDVFSIIVVVAIVTSLMVPSLLRITLARIPITPEERERLAHAERLRGNPLASAQRVLVPVRLREDAHTGAAQAIEAAVLARLAGERKLNVTLLCVVPPDQKAQATAFLDQIARHFAQHQVQKKVVIGSRPETAILDEAGKTYDLLVMGAPEGGSGSNVLFGPLIDYVVRFVPCPAIVVRGQELPQGWQPRRLLVPTNGSLAARRAAQLGFALGGYADANVTVLKVVVPDPMSYAQEPDAAEREQLQIAQQVVTELQGQGTSLGVRVDADVVIAPDPVAAILNTARNIEADLIILGTKVRSGSERLYLGARVDRILRHAHCPVMIINTALTDSADVVQHAPASVSAAEPVAGTPAVQP